MSNLKKLHGKLHKAIRNDKGSSIIMVMIALAFVGVLATILVYLAYYNFLMKSTDRNAKTNFYTAESALDEINLGLQGKISEAMSESYTSVMQEYANETADVKKYEFQQLFEKKLINKLKTATSTPTDVHYEIETGLKAYLVNTAYDNVNHTGAEILTTNTENLISMDSNNNIVLRDLKIRYTDEKKYVSLISTDIVLKIPPLDFATVISVPDIETYSLIADSALDVSDNITGVKVSGNVYGGTTGINVSGDSKLTFGKKPTDATTLLNRVIAGSLNASNGYREPNKSPAADSVTIPNANYQLWVENVNVDSAAVSLLGETYVKDDLQVDGGYSKVKLGNKYYGYGEWDDAVSEGSSSILINGANTTLDFQSLLSFSLAGHSYVGTRHYDPNKDLANEYTADLKTISGNTTTNKYPVNGEDILMGQSLAVKSDQLLYMVPIECMGYEGDTQILAKNPLTYAEYEKLTKTYTNPPTNTVLQYQVVRPDIVMNKLGKSLQSYGASYRPVFRNVNNTILVYYYLYFQSETMANQFFSDYFAAAPDSVNTYVKTYVKSFKWNSNLGQSGTTLSLAGNLLTYNSAGKIVLKKDTSATDASNLAALTDERASYVDKFTALNCKLEDNKNALSASQLSSTVYGNIIVNDSTFASIVGSGAKTFGDGSVKAIAVNNADGKANAFHINNTTAADVNLVVAKGSVIVEKDFEGLILAGETIYIDPACNNINYNSDLVRKAMGLTDGSKFMSDLFVDGASYANFAASVSGNTVSANKEAEERQKDYVVIADLIEYNNWKKE